MVYKTMCIPVLWMRIASALEGLTRSICVCILPFQFGMVRMFIAITMVECRLKWIGYASESRYISYTNLASVYWTLFVIRCVYRPLPSDGIKEQRSQTNRSMGHTVQTSNSCTSRPDVEQCLAVHAPMDNVLKDRPIILITHKACE